MLLYFVSSDSFLLLIIFFDDIPPEVQFGKIDKPGTIPGRMYGNPEITDLNRSLE
jgi:hypothetical protein